MSNMSLLRAVLDFFSLMISAEYIRNPRDFRKKTATISLMSKPVALSLPSLGVHQRNFDCQPGRPTTEVFIGLTNGRDSGYKSVLQAPMLVHRVVSANHRISSLRQDVVESVLFSGCSSCTFGGISAATSIRYRRIAAWRVACLRKMKDSDLGMSCSVSEWQSIDRFTKHRELSNK